MKETFVHYGSRIYIPEMVKPIKNRLGWCKPKGGFWMSPVNSDYGWKEWCIAEEYKPLEYFDISMKLAFKEDARIYIINTLDDLEKLELTKHKSWLMHLNFERLTKEYDAIWLTVQGERQTRYSDPISLYGWDMESILVLNPNSIYQIL